ncbi:hypothetical protein [Acidovorax sp. RAC01]|uniref:hypothetical protein n=1 Tax=Acidovorax sp. RAC01 TaxID=1842533 RepID=UPI00083E8E21|nr:hypothetical protein [Acidovorax sp. RAC01]AOG24776.1 hypothetical protein BSY15_3903 [Acidovorax sp. RAC01]
MQDDLEDRLVDLDDRAVPHAVRAAVRAIWQPGDTLWRCPRMSAPRGILGVAGVGRRERVIEWWLLSPEGDLIEAFWEK